MMAARHGHTASLQAPIDCGADLRMRDSNSQTISHYAADVGKITMVAQHEGPKLLTDDDR